jgi:hypothetical protein
MTVHRHAILFFFFLDIEKKATTAYCHRLLCSNSTTQKDNDTLSLFSSFLTQKNNGNKLPLPSSLEHHQRRRRWQQATIVFFFVAPPQKKTTIHCHHFLLLKHKEDKTHKKITKRKRREGSYLQAPTLPSHFWLSLLPFCFKCFLLASSCPQAKKKKKKPKEKKINAKKGGSFPSNSRSALSLLDPTFAFPLLPFYFKCFFLASSSSQT